MNEFYKNWNHRTDSEWLQALIKSVSNPDVDGVRFPTFPDPEMQRFIQGASGEAAIRGAHRFYVEVRLAASAAGRPFGPDRTLLDFGSGWGRTVRPFMRDFDLKNIIGLEPEEKWCQEARKLNNYISFINSEFEPPTILSENKFDYITSYSVFTHLPMFLFRNWIEEFWRVLKPGGVVVFTFLSDRLVREIDASVTSGEELQFWHKILYENLGDANNAIARINRGELLFLKTHSVDTYGDTFMSAETIRKTIGAKFEICHLNQKDLAQDVCAIKKL